MTKNTLFAEMSKDLHYVLFPDVDIHRTHSGISVLAELAFSLVWKNGTKSNSDPVRARLLACGSHFELPQPGSTSDIDMMVVDHIEIANNRTESERKHILIYEDAWHSGFVKLLWPFRGKVGHIDIYSDELVYPAVYHGPAILIPGKKDSVYQILDMDFVHAIPCKQWPSQAEEWLRRPRPSGWPSQEQIKHIVEMGCHVVPIGHPNSAMQDSEWRLSFSQAERYLLQSLDCNQVLSFVFARRVLSSIKDKDDKICSFYVKTMFLWLCEEKPVNYWKESTIVQTAVDVIERLSKCLKDHHLPNYFVRNNNLIDHLSRKVVRASSKRLQQALHTDSLIQVSVRILKDVGFTNSKPSHTSHSWSFDWLEQPMFHEFKQGAKFEKGVKTEQLITNIDHFIRFYEGMLNYYNNMQRLDTEFLLQQTLEKSVQITDDFERLHLACAMIFLGLCLEFGIITAPADHFTKPWSQSMEELAKLYRLNPALKRDAMSKCSKPGKLYVASLYMKQSYDSFDNARQLYFEAMKLIPKIETQMRLAIAVSYFTQENYLAALRHINLIIEHKLPQAVYPSMLLAFHPKFCNLRKLGKCLTCHQFYIGIAVECLLRIGKYEKADKIMSVFLGCGNSAGIPDTHTWLSWHLIFTSFSVRWGKDWMKLLLSTKGNITQKN